MNAWTRAALAVLATGLLVVVVSCNRQPRFMPPDADSTASAVDSSVVELRGVQEGWESGEHEAAAERTARVLAARLASVSQAEWSDHAASLLDSLGVGHEIASGACVVIVNMFARSDPQAGSWPYLISCDGDRPHVQAVEGQNLHLQQVMSRGLAGVQMPESALGPGVAALTGRRSGGGHQPLLMVWERRGQDAWALAQTLGPDSLGGIGTGEFETPADTTIDLVTRTYRVPPMFEECATCPHLYRLRRFRWGPEGFHKIEDQLVPSTYATFVRFVQALVANDRDAADPLVANRDLWDDARRFEWHRVRGSWRVAPATDESPRHIVFFRGDHEAYRVDFESRGDEWLIAGFESVPRTVE